MTPEEDALATVIDLLDRVSIPYTDLGRNVYRVDLSQVVSKYIGETEKNLGHVAPDSRRGDVTCVERLQQRSA